MTDAFWIKLLAAPLLIAVASLAGKRWGGNIAGLLGGLPLIGGPVVLALWLTHGAAYATQVALAAPGGVWANIIYMLTLAYFSARWRWYIAIAMAWGCYLATALLINLTSFADSLIFGVAVLPALWLAATRALPRPIAPTAPAHLPRIELLARMLAAAALVLTLTAASSKLGAQFTGILTGAPVAAVVIPAFTLVNAGRDALLMTLRGFLTGLMGFTVFFLILGHAADDLGIASLPAALMGGVGVGFIATQLSHRRVAMLMAKRAAITTRVSREPG